MYFIQDSPIFIDRLSTSVCILVLPQLENFYFVPAHKYHSDAEGKGSAWRSCIALLRYPGVGMSSNALSKDSSHVGTLIRAAAGAVDLESVMVVSVPH